LHLFLQAYTCMLITRRILLVFLALFFCKTFAVANTFTVTTNADSGPGSLRDAITQCAANGITVRDSIIFSIPDNSVAGRTITLVTELPALTSNMVINGISQNGSPIGVSEAQIILFLSTYNGYFNFLEVYDCTDVGIYGLAMISAYTNNMNYQTSGVSYVRCHNLQIGRPGAGNYIFGCTNGIYSQTGRYGNYVMGDTSRALTIQSNIIGLDMNGGFSNMYQGVTVTLMYYSIFIIGTSDIIIGGSNSSYGNTVYNSMVYPGYSFEGINLDIESYNNLGNGVLQIDNNKFGTRIDGTLDPNYTSVPVLIYIVGAESDYAFDFTNNILQGEISITSIGKYFTIQGNTIFSPRVNTVYDCAITLTQNNGGGLIGGTLPGQANTIYNTYYDTLYYFEDNVYEAGIRFDLQSHTTILNNIMLCNTYHSSGIMDNENNGMLYVNAWVRIDSTGVNFVKGKATPNTRIDVYLDDDCLACEGKKYLGFTMSNGDSTWQYTGVFNAVVVATCTAPNGQTSWFSAPEIIEDRLQIKQPTCGKKNGYIKGLQISGGDNVKWHYMYKVNGNWRDSVIATTIDLDSAGPGLYFFDAWLGKTCRSYYKQYTLYDQSPKLDTSQINIQNPACGKFNGSITNISLNTTQDIKITWKNEFGATVGNQLDLTNAGPGKYKLIIMDTVAGCGDSTFLYQLINQSGPSVNINTAQVTATTCNQANGNITNIQFTSITGTAIYYWYDSLNNIVGSTADLLNVHAGKYLLKFKDQGACDTITTPFIIVPDSGGIQIDTSAIIIGASSCTSSTGSITNITIANGINFKWIDTVTQTVVSTNKDLQNAAPGYYKLIATSALGCTDSTSTYYIPQADTKFYNINGIGGSPETCGRNNGSAYVTSANTSQTGFTFAWIDSATNQVLSTALTLQNVGAGTYYCYSIDDNGCKRLMGSVGINNLVPSVNAGAAIVSPDVCMQHNGSVTKLDVQSYYPYTTTWYNNAGQTIAQTTDLLNVPAGVYYLVVNDSTNCADTSMRFTIGDTTVSPAPPIYNPVTIVKGSSAKLVVTNPETGTYQLFASQNSATPDQSDTSGTFVTGILNNDTSVYVSLKNGDCISVLAPVLITVVETLELVMPNAFTPDNNGHNDLFRVKYPGLIKTMQMQVFSRWGQKVFESTNPSVGWDGTINGIKQPSGNYVWTIYYTDILGNKKKQSGNVVLIR
jgi:gliding motility-associated-like protein